MKRFKRKALFPLTEVNVVSLMDIMTTLLFFLILMASWTHFSSMKSKAAASATSNNEKHKFSLAVVLVDRKNIEVHLGKIDKLEVTNTEALANYLAQNFSGNAKAGYKQKITSASTSQSEEEQWKEMLKKLHASIKAIKSSFPTEDGASLVIANNIIYQDIISAMEVISSEKTLALFPDITLQESLK
ncbi:MAG: biopolymer transporter ExbD [Oligoflexia bacterium]|nr:biopolymer transporter ExbD [Oligoflexia bacterium]MBF0365102.1 biopolymer transporter ExbD [Oligoflexia bacterium]